MEQRLEMYRASKPTLRKALLRWLPSKNTHDLDEVHPFWANPTRRNCVLLASGSSVTYRDALMSRGDRLAFPVRGSRFRPPLRYLGHSSSKSRNQNQNQKQIQIQVYRGRRVDEAREEKRSKVAGAVAAAGAVPHALCSSAPCGG